MATFSPSPAPRRSTRIRARSPTRRNPTIGRLESPSVENSNLTENELFRSAMDVDEVLPDSGLSSTGEIIYAKTEELSVSFYANLPVEVKQVLRNADFCKTPYTGEIDTTTGFALVASAQTCFVWQHAQAIKGTPTCYIFACPQDTHQNLPLDRRNSPFHALVPHGSSREPGLILISSTGQIRFWDSISIGLAGGDRYDISSLDLADEDDHVTSLVRSDPQTFIVATSLGNLYRLMITSTGGKCHLTSRAFTQPGSRSFSGLLPSFFTATPSMMDLKSYIRSISLGLQSSTGERDLWVLTEERVQKWVIKTDGWEEKKLDLGIADSLQSAVQEFLGIRQEPGEWLQWSIELLDLAVEDAGMVAVLLSYCGKEGGVSVRRLYALAHLAFVGKTFEIADIKTVPYQSTSTSPVPAHPRIQVLFSGSLISVQFGDAVALCARESEYQDRLELKSTIDRTLGVGVSQTNNTLLVLTASTLMKVHLDMERILAFNPDTGRTNLIKSIMMQAILYGPSPENPLHFSFPPEVDEESLMRGAEQLSRAVLRSDPEVVRNNHDLSAQLTSRKDRLSWLIGFINDNSVLVKMSQRSRQKLAMDAEKLYASHQLWLQYNELLATLPKHSVLNDCVHAYMADVADGPHEDVMRAFFRLRVSDVGKLLKKILDIVTLSSQQAGRDVSQLLAEANSILVTVLRSAFDYRTYNLKVYGIDLPMIFPWTSRPAVVDTVLASFDATTKAVESRYFDSSNQGKLQQSQLPELAALLFECIKERLDWLSSPIAAAEPGVGRDKDELEHRFTLLRPEVLETLRRFGHQDTAFQLAEKYHDFSSLVALCHKDVAYPPTENPNLDRIQSYVDRFKYDFACQLYRWYIQHGELRVMFNQSSALQSGYLERFFSEEPNAAISWIYNIGKEHYERAAADLLEEASKASNLEVKHLMLSVGKLSHLAQLHETSVSADQSVLDAFHDDLDFISVHETLLQDFRTAIQGLRGRQSLENQIEHITKAKASPLIDQKALTNVFKDLVRQLLQGRALSIEDIVDLLTLKDNTTSVEDYGTALHLLARVDNLPETRKLSAFRTVWRRIFLHDDWENIRKTANISDAELKERFQNTALYATLYSILPSINQPNGFVTEPNFALVIPSTMEVASRWPGISAEQVDAIVRDYTTESDRLGDLDLEDVYHRVYELAIHDKVWQGSTGE